MSLSAAGAKRILLIASEPGLAIALRDRLTNEGYAVVHAGDDGAALASARTASFDLVLLDVVLPGLAGFDVCRRLREQGVRVPIILMTAGGRVIDTVIGFKLGADDCVTTPVDMRELLARIEARLRPARPGTVPSTHAGSYQFGAIRVDFRGAEVWRHHEPVALPARQFQLLRYFVAHRGATLSRDELLNEVWGYDAIPTTRTVDVHVAWLRQKIEPIPKRPQYLLTVHGLGYKFVG